MIRESRAAVCGGDRGTYYVHSVHDADPQSHEGFGEINDLLSLSRDGQAGHSQVSLLKHMQNNSRHQCGSG